MNVWVSRRSRRVRTVVAVRGGARIETFNAGHPEWFDGDLDAHMRDIEKMLPHFRQAA